MNARQHGRNISPLSNDFDIETPVILGRPMVVPTEDVICFAIGDIYRISFGGSKPPPYGKRCRKFVGERLEELSKSVIWHTTPMQQRSKSTAIG